MNIATCLDAACRAMQDICPSSPPRNLLTLTRVIRQIDEKTMALQEVRKDGEEEEEEEVRRRAEGSNGRDEKEEEPTNCLPLIPQDAAEDFSFPPVAAAVKWAETELFSSSSASPPDGSAKGIMFFDEHQEDDNNSNSSTSLMRFIWEQAMNWRSVLPEEAQILLQSEQSTLDNNNKTPASSTFAHGTSINKVTDPETEEHRLCLTLSNAQCCALLAHAFLGTNLEHPFDQEGGRQQLRFDGTIQPRQCGNASHRWLLTSKSPIASERLKCLLVYFVAQMQSGSLPPESAAAGGQKFTTSLLAEDVIKFHRISHKKTNQSSGDESNTSGPFSNVLTRLTQKRPCPRLCSVHISHTRKMEDVAPTQQNAPHHNHQQYSIMDFANEQYGYGIIIPSATQEEILFSTRPALMAAMPFIETLRDDEAVVVEGARCFAEYGGYGDTFRCRVPSPLQHSGTAATPPPNVIVADSSIAVGALTDGLDRKLLERDALKLHLAFMDVEECHESCSSSRKEQRVLSTGGWGCGVFGGDPVLKFLVQWCVFSVAHSSQRASQPELVLHYSTFGNEPLADLLNAVHQHILDTQTTPSELWSGLLLDPEDKLRAFIHQATFDGAASPPPPGLLIGKYVLQEWKMHAIHSCSAKDDDGRQPHQRQQHRVQELEDGLLNGALQLRKLCRGGCGWDLGAGNTSDYCSKCCQAAAAV